MITGEMWDVEDVHERIFHPHDGVRASVIEFQWEKKAAMKFKAGD